MTPVPLIILGGADRRPSKLPPSGKDKHPLVGYKGVDVRIGGRPLIAVVADALRESGAFDPIVIAGPARIYRDAGVRLPVADTDGGFGRNIREGIEYLRPRHPGSPLGITTCDILPSPSDVSTVMRDYHEHRPAALWAPLIRNPDRAEALGEFAWKPKYAIVPDGGNQPVDVLPGHLVVFNPDALRLRFLYRLMQIGYSTRNRPIAYRRASMIRQLLWGLLFADVKRLVRMRIPNITWSVLGAGVTVAHKLRQGTITQERLEWGIERVFVRTMFRRRNRGCVRMPIVETLSFARDIDTEEEAVAAGGKRAGPA